MIRTFRAVVAGAALAAGSALAAAPAAAQQTYTLQAMLNGQQQNPDVITPATGMATIRYTPNFGMPALGSMQIMLQINNLPANRPTGGVEGPPAHIHIGAREQNGPVVISFVGFPVGQTGTFTYNTTLQLSSLNLTTAQLANLQAFNAQIQSAQFGQDLNFYVNVHTTANPGGEIRGQLAVVPEPSTYALLATGVAGLGAVARRRQRQTAQRA
jgi:hypothetical protein